MWRRGWSADGRFLFQVMDTRGLMSLWITSPETRLEPVAFKGDVFNYNHADLSPDGRWVAYASDLSGRYELYVDSFPTPGRRRPVPGSAGGREPRWRHDGRELSYVSADSMLVAVAVTPGDVPAFGDPQPLFALRLPGPVVNRPTVTHNDVARDGRFLAAVVERDAPVVSEPVTVSLNATAALRQSAGR